VCLLICFDRGCFKAHNVDVQWTEYPGGTGDMCKAVSKGDVDVAIMLTEGALVQALKDPKIKIVGVYVSTSAIWGIHAGAESCSQSDIKDMRDVATFAISRFGSGSHLMSFVLAESLGWKPDSLKFEVVGGLAGAREKLPEDGSLVFMWEKFTTLPCVVDGTFKRVGEFPTPWPFFIVAANADYLESSFARQDLQNVLKVVRDEANLFKNGGQETLDYIQKVYKIQPEAGAEWLKTVEWACSPVVDLDMLFRVGETLHRLGKIDSEKAPTREEIESSAVLKL